MKTQPMPATVHEVDEQDIPILHSKRSAARIKKPASTSPSSQNEKKSEVDTMTLSQSTIVQGESICKGTIQEMMEAYHQSNPHGSLTIFTRSQDDSEERNEVPGYKFRKIFFKDDTEVVNPAAVFDRSRFVRLTVIIPEKDQAHADPRLYVEQRVYEGLHERILVNELSIGKGIKDGMEYLFPGCGDGDLGIGKRDLRLTIKPVDQESFNYHIMNHATYYGYNRTEYALVNKYTLSNGLTYGIRYSGNGEMSPYKIMLDHDDLQSLLEVKQKKQGSTNGHGLPSNGLQLLKLRFKGLGGLTHDGLRVGHLDIHVVYKP